MGRKIQRGISVLDRGDNKTNNEIICSKETEETEGDKKEAVEENKKINVDIGLDISSSCTGVCILDHHTGNLVQLFPIKLTSTKLEDLFDKINVVSTIFNNLKNSNKYNVKNIYVEEIAKKFTGGISSAQTIITLAQMNILVCYEANKIFNLKPKYINVRSARKSIGIAIDQKDKTKSTKEKVFEKVLERNKDFPWHTHIAKTGKHKDEMVYDKCNEDMADSWVIVKSGQITRIK